MPVFALANAGVALAFGALDWETAAAVGIGLALGKPLGITAAAWLACRAGWASLPPGVTWPMLHGCAWIAGIGFTMSLFIAGLAFGASPRFDAARIGIVGASVVAALVGALILRRASAAEAADDRAPAHAHLPGDASADALRPPPARAARRRRRADVSADALSPALSRHRRGVSLGRSRRWSDDDIQRTCYAGLASGWRASAASWPASSCGLADGSTEIAYFGLLPAFIGRGLGGALLTAACAGRSGADPGVAAHLVARSSGGAGQLRRGSAGGHALRRAANLEL